MNPARLVNKLRKLPQETRVLIACILLGDWCAEDRCDGADQTVHLPNGDKMHVDFRLETAS
ncbi:MAG: hypothetical protein OSB62_08970 [Alphaproteobacteria bacterium]|nr:hypothetical protein [Alphaproteobacteria bacterium]